MHVCAHAQNYQNLCFVLTRSMDVDESSDKTSRPLALLSILEYAFIRDILRKWDRYRDLVCWTQFCVHDPRRKRHNNPYTKQQQQNPAILPKSSSKFPFF